MGIEQELKEETTKWLDKCQVKRKEVELKVPSKKRFLENIDAYLEDAGHFQEGQDWVRAFEATVWAWAWMEIGLQEGFLKEKKG